jgi:hypothetical protein
MQQPAAQPAAAHAPQAHPPVVVQPDTVRPASPPRLGEPGYPPLPPQERFEDWGKLRAPVRDMERAPSLFERVTASFGRQREDPAQEPVERAPEPAMAGDSGERRAGGEEEVYDIPAFLRR